MENKANYALVGALSLALVVALFGFVYWFAGPSSSVPLKAYDVVFNGAVSGVRTGTEVTFNGVPVGQVRAVSLDPNDSNRVIVRVEVADSTPVHADTKAVLGFQGLTGLGSIELSGGTVAAGDPEPAPGLSVPTLYAESSNFQSILDGVASTVTGANTAIERLNGFLDTNAGKLDQTVSDVQSFSSALAANSEGLERFLSGVADAGEQIGPMTEEIRTLSADLRSLVNAVPAEQVTKVVGDVGTFTDSLARNAGQIDTFFSRAETLSADLTDITSRLKASAAAVEAVTAEVDPAAVSRAVDNLDNFAETLTRNSENFDTIANNVAMLTQSLNESSGQITQAISDVSTFGATLARNADQVDSFFAATSTLSTDITDIAARIRAVTEEVDPMVVGRAVNNLDSFAATLNGNSENLDTIVSNVASLSETLNASSGQVTQAISDVSTFGATLARNSEQVDGFFASASTLSTDLQDITASLKTSATTVEAIIAEVDPATVSTAVDDLGRFANRLGDNSDNVDAIMTNARELTAALNASSAQIDTILARVNTIVGEADGTGMFEDISAAAQSVRLLADQLNAATTQIASGLNDFTNRGLSEYTALAVSARSTLQRLDNVVRNLEQNPQALVFGGQTVRDYTKQ